MQLKNATKSWYYRDKKKERQGPVKVSVLRTLWVSGAVDANTLVWAKGQKGWEPISKVAELSKTIVPPAGERTTCYRNLIVSLPFPLPIE